MECKNCGSSFKEPVVRLTIHIEKSRLNDPWEILKNIELTTEDFLDSVEACPVCHSEEISLNRLSSI